MTPPAAGRRLKHPNRTWVRPFREGAGPLYLQIAQQVREAVDDGVLRPGDRLPPQRDLAQQVGVDLTTVTRAFAELRQAGLLDAQGAGGTFIALSAGNRSTSVDLSMNIPPLLGSAPFAQGMEAGFQHVGQQLGQGELMSYHVGAGTREDRAAAVQWLAPMLGTVGADQVVICPGAQTALCALILARTQPGELIAAEQLTYLACWPPRACCSGAWCRWRWTPRACCRTRWRRPASYAARACCTWCRPSRTRPRQRCRRSAGRPCWRWRSATI